MRNKAIAAPTTPAIMAFVFTRLEAGWRGMLAGTAVALIDVVGEDDNDDDDDDENEDDGKNAIKDEVENVVVFAKADVEVVC